MKIKKIIASIFAIYMVLCTIGFNVFAADYVAYIGEQGYETLQTALDATKEMSGNVVIELLADATLDITAWQTLAIGGENTESITINGNDNTLTFNHLNSDWNNVATNNAKLILNDMKITNSGYNNGPWNRHDINFACNVELNNVTSDKALAFKAGAVLDTVTISDANTSDTYAIWIQPNGQTVTITNSTIDMLACSDGRGIKIDNQYNEAQEQKVTLIVSDTSFETEEKAAIMVKSAVGADITLSDVDISGVVADSVNAVWNDADSASSLNLITVTGGTMAQEGTDGTPVRISLNGSGTETNPFVIENIDDLKWFRDDVNNGNTYEGKYVLLTADIDFEGYEEMNVSGTLSSTFRPIGDSGCDASFNGTFDGGEKTISNLYQSGWELGYEWGSYGSLGLFGVINGATIKNLTVSGFELVVEGGDVAAIAGSATGTCVFRNINVEGCICATYNNGCGSIIAWSGAGDYTFENIKIDDEVILAGLWGSFDSSIGGVVGQAEPGATYTLKNVDIACRLDVYNDSTASYDYYNYRMCGMIIGRLEETTTVDGRNYPDMSKYNITCDNVKVTIGEWANYHYCEPTPGYNNGRGMRVEPGYAYDGLPADYDHSQCTTNHMELMEFKQLFGGAQLGVDGADKTILEKQNFDTSTLEVVDLAKIARSNVAKIGDTYFASLQDAVNAANDGDVITLINNINLADTDLQILDGSYDTYFLVEGKNITIDLNGKTISGAYTGSMLVGVFSTDKNGHLTITGNGTVDVTATGKVYALVACYNDGSTINIENGTYTLDNASDSLIFYGGKTDAAVTVKGGTFTLGNVGIGENGKPWTFNVLGAGDHHVFITGGTFNADINRQHWSNEAVVDETCYTVDNGDGTYTVKDGAVAYVNTGMTTGPYYAPKNIGYATLTEAIAAAVAANDSPVVLIKNIINVEEFAINTNSSIVLDLNGKTLNGAIKPSTGDITVKNGSIINKNSGISAIEVNSGKLTLENVNIDSERHAVRIDGAVDATINGGIYKVLVNNRVSAHTINVSGSAVVTIKDGTFCGPKGTPNGSAMGGSALQSRDTAVVTVEGGNFSGGVNNTIIGKAVSNVSVTGGTFDQDPSAYVADGYKSFKNGDETYTVRSIKPDAYTVTAKASATKVRYNKNNTPDTFTVEYIVTGGNVIGAMAQYNYDNTLFTCAEDDDNDGKLILYNNDLTTDANGETIIAKLTFTVKKDVEVDTTYEFLAEKVQVTSDYDAAGSGAQDGFVENVVGDEVTVVAQWKVTLPGDNSLAGNTYVDKNTDYSATINNFDENMTYTIKYTMGDGAEQTIEVTENNFVIETVTGDIVFTDVSYELNCEIVLVPDYVNGCTLVIVKDGVANGYTYDNAPMYPVARYENITELPATANQYIVGNILNATSVRAILIKGAVDEAQARAAIKAAASEPADIEKSFDVNGNGDLYFNDAMTAHGCYKEQYDLALKLAYYLRADVDTDLKIRTLDYDATVGAILDQWYGNQFNICGLNRK